MFTPPALTPMLSIVPPPLNVNVPLPTLVRPPVLALSTPEYVVLALLVPTVPAASLPGFNAPVPSSPRDGRRRQPVQIQTVVDSDIDGAALQREPVAQHDLTVLR